MGGVVARVCVCCRCKKNPKHAVRLGFLSRIFPSNNLGLRLSGVGGWGAEGPAQAVGYVANSLSTRKLLAAQRSFRGATGELE